MIWLLGLIVLYFWPSLGVYFAQDDFWLLSISKAHTIEEIANFFIPRTDIVWYRPLSSQVFFWLGKQIFQLQPVPYHLVVLATHLGAVILMYYVVHKLTQDKTIALVAAGLYGINQNHVVSLSWLASYSFVLGPLCLLFVLYMYMQNKKTLAWIGSFIGMLVTEVLIIIPFLLLAYELLLSRKIRLWSLLPYFLLALGELWYRFIAFPTQLTNSSYTLSFSTQLWETAKFYLWRLVGFPLQVNLLPSAQKLFVVAMGFTSVIIITIGTYRMYKQKQKRRMLFFLVSVFITGGGLFLFLPNHVAPYYIVFAWVGGAILVALAFNEMLQMIPKKRRYLVFWLIVISFLLQQLIGARLTYETHWVFSRAHLARKLVETDQLTAPVGSEEYFALGANTAAEVFADK